MSVASSVAPVGPAPTGENPGKTMGIVGLILAFVANIAGLIVSIIALNKSKKAGFNNGPALAGIIVSIVSIIVLVIAIALFAAAAAAGLAALQEMCTGLEAGVYDLGNGQTVTCG